MGFRMIFFVLCCLTSAMLHAQPSSYSFAVSYVEAGDHHVQSEQYEAAEEAYQRALSYFERATDYNYLARIYLGLSEVDYIRGAFKEGLEKVEHCYSLVNEHLDRDTLDYYRMILQNLGAFNSRLGNFDAQMQWYEQAHQASITYHGYHSEAAADAYLSLGYAFGRRGDWSQCISLMDTSLEISKHIRYRDGISSAYLNLGYSFAEKGDYQKAAEYQKEGLKYCVRESERAKGLHNLGTYYIDLGDLDKALESLQKGLDIYENEAEEFQYRKKRILLNIARVYTEMGEVEKALPIFNQQIAELRNIPEYAFLVQTTQNYKAELLREMGALDDAQALIETAMTNQHDYIDVKGASCMTAAKIYLQAKQYEKAIEVVNEGLSYAVSDFSPEKPDGNPDWQAIEHLELGRKLFKIKGDIQREMGVNRNSSADLLASRATLLRGDSLVMWTRSTFRNQRSKDVLAASANEMYSSLLSTLYHLYQSTGKAQYFEEAVTCVEKNKALSILENLNSIHARSFSGVPDEVVEEEQALIKHIQNYSMLLKFSKGGASPAQIETWEAALFKNRRLLDSLLAVIKLEYPRYYQMKHEYTMGGADKIVKDLLQPNEAILEYFVQEDEVFVLYLSDSERLFYKLNCQGLSSLVEQLRHAAVYRENEFYHLGYQLYQCLLQPIEPKLTGKSLVIIPDGILNYVPFEMLLMAPVDASGSIVHAELPYLIKEFSVRYLFSANTALQFRRTRKMNKKGTILAMAPLFGLPQSSTDAERDGLISLPGAQLELDSLEAFFRGQYLRGAKATEQRFKQYCMQPGIFHIATHTIIEEALVRGPYLILEPEGEEDGFLHAYEMYGLELGADLSVLSGCNTGVGELKKGEGSASLAHAFAYAGCPNLVMSLWPVRDQTTPILMSRFYRNMDKGMGKSEALREAKLYCLKYDNLFAHPYYWSGFLYVGGAESINIANRITLGNIGLVIAILLIGIIGFLLIKRVRS